MAGMAIVVVLLSMASSWLVRGLLLRTLRDKHPREFGKLGNPSPRQLASLLPRYREMQIRFWKYLWDGEVFLVEDSLVSNLARAALISDVVLAIGVVGLLWSAGR